VQEKDAVRKIIKAKSQSMLFLVHQRSKTVTLVNHISHVMPEKEGDKIRKKKKEKRRK
jgi:hypothetical protein